MAVGRSKDKGGGQKTKAAVKRQRRRSWRPSGLHEPFAGNEIFEEYNSSTSFEDNRKIST
jgi:hypothetical protein